MNIDKLKPWNWFKHEDDSANQIPVHKQDITQEHQGEANLLPTQTGSAVSSFLQLHREMDRLFDNLWRSFDMPLSRYHSPLFHGASAGEPFAKVDIAGSENAYEIMVELPGLTDKDIELVLNENTLTVKGHAQEEKETKDRQYYRIERSTGVFQRTLSLPEDADRNDITASMKHGVLHINVPRKALPPSDVKRIEITS